MTFVIPFKLGDFLTCIPISLIVFARFLTFHYLSLIPPHLDLPYVFFWLIIDWLASCGVLYVFSAMQSRQEYVHILYEGKAKKVQVNIARDVRLYGTCDDQIKEHPEVVIAKRSEDDCKKIGWAILNNKKVDAHDVCAVLAYLLNKHVTQALTEDFAVCGLPIGSAGQVITPINFIRLRDTPPKTERVDEYSSMNPEDEIPLLSRLLVTYRYHLAQEISASDNTYITRVTKAIRQAVEKLNVNLDSFSFQNATSIMHHESFMRLLCSTDMFFVAFPRHMCSCLKVGTLVMRFKDMSQVNNITYLEDMTGMPWNEVIYFTFDQSVIGEYTSINYGKWSAESYYYPYQSSMNLLDGKHTYMSNTRNPKFQNVVQILGILKISTRSFNSYITRLPVASEIAQSVLFFVATPGGSGFAFNFYKTADQLNQAARAVSAREHEGKHPFLVAKDFYEGIPENADIYTAVAEKSLNAAKDHAALMTSLRPRSYGEWIKNLNIDLACDQIHACFQNMADSAIAVEEALQDW